MKKRLLSFVLALCMMLTLLPTVALADTPQAQWGEAGIGDTEPTEWTQGTLAQAMSYANSLTGGDTAYIQLLANINTSNHLSPWPLTFASGKTTILDLNGKDINRGLSAANGGGNIISVLGNLTLKDGSTADVENQGKITGGYNSDYGGGVYVNGATFTMTGGNITGNKATNTMAGGGGVYVNGNFTMTGGSITGNEALNWGGGVYAQSGFFIMLGGSITGNKSGHGGIFSSSSFTVGGTTVIKDNTVTSSSAECNLVVFSTPISVNSLIPGASIGVTASSTPIDDSPVDITGTNSADYSRYFFSDSSSYTIQNGESNVVQLAVPLLAIGMAKSAVEGAIYANMTQAEATDEDAIKTALNNTAVTAVGNSDITITINKVSYTAPIAGTSANPGGTNGSYTFTVTVSKGGQSDTTTQKTITITATAYTGITDVQAVAAAKTAAQGAGYSNMTQAAATDENAIETALKNTAAAAVNNSGVSITINKISYTLPAAGTSANPGGTNGSYTFTVTVSKGTQSETTTQKTITITATAYTGGSSGDGNTGGSNTPPAAATIYNDPSQPKATIWLSGSGLSQGELLLTPALTKGGDYNAFLKLADAAAIVRIYDVSVKSGKKPVGKDMSLTFDLGTQYAGQSFTLVHKKADGTFEYFFATANARGIVSFGPLAELSPFMLVKGKMPYTPLHEIVEVPKTGDSATSIGFAFLSLSIMLSALWLMRQNKSKRT